MQEKSPLNSSSQCPEARDTITATLTCLPSVQSKVNSSETSARQMMCEILVLWILTSSFQLCGIVRVIFSRENECFKNSQEAEP